MKKALAFVCLLAILTVSFCSCSGFNCEHCGASSLIVNQVGDDANGIKVCDTCIEKMSMSKISFQFTCDLCEEEIVGKKNEVIIGGETKIACNTCYNAQ